MVSANTVCCFEQEVSVCDVAPKEQSNIFERLRTDKSKDATADERKRRIGQASNINKMIWKTGLSKGSERHGTAVICTPLLWRSMKTMDTTPEASRESQDNLVDCDSY
jgi:hypothetical protein